MVEARWTELARYFAAMMPTMTLRQASSEFSRCGFISGRRAVRRTGYCRNRPRTDSECAVQVRRANCTKGLVIAESIDSAITDLAEKFRMTLTGINSSATHASTSWTRFSRN